MQQQQHQAAAACNACSALVCRLSHTGRLGHSQQGSHSLAQQLRRALGRCQAAVDAAVSEAAAERLHPLIERL